MFIMSVIFFVLAGLIGLFVRDHPPGVQPGKHKRKAIGIGRSLSRVFSNPQSWWNALYVGLLFAPTAAFAELWGVTHLVHTHGLAHHVAAAAIGMIFLGWAVGGPFAGWFSDKIGRRKPVMIASALFSCLFISIALYVPQLSVTSIFICLFLYGMSNTGVAIGYAVASEINPPWVSGTSMAFANMMSVLPGAALQPVIGWLIDLHAGHKIVNGVLMYSAADFYVAMSLLPVSLLLAIVIACLVRETHCQVVNE